MSIMVHRLRRLITRLFVPPGPTLDPEAMRLQEWADLPAYHPLCDRTPC